MYRSNILQMGKLLMMITFAALLIVPFITGSGGVGSISFQQQLIRAFGQQTEDGGDVGNDVINVSHNNGTSSFFTPPEDFNRNSFMAASGNNVYVVWEDNSTGSLGSHDIFLARSTDNGSSFDNPIDLSMPLRNNGSTFGNSYSPQIAAAGNNVYVVWIESVYAPTGDRQDWHILYAKSSDGGNTFQGPFDMSGNVELTDPLAPDASIQGTNPQITASGDNAYVTWSSHPLIVSTATQAGGLGSGEIFFSRIAPNGFTTPVNLSENVGESNSPHIASSRSNVYVIWTDNTSGDNEILFKRITDKGATIGPTINLSDDFNQQDNPQMAAAGNNVYVIWQSSGKNETGATSSGIWFESSQDNGVTFGKPVFVMSTKGDPAIGPHHHLAIGKNGSINVVWDDGEPGQRGVFFSKSNTTDSITFPLYWTLSNKTGLSVLPQISVSGTHVYVTYTDNTSGDFEVYFTEASFVNGGNDTQVSFSDPINLSNDEGDSVFTQMLSIGNHVYVSWMDDSSGNWEIYFERVIN